MPYHLETRKVLNDGALFASTVVLHKAPKRCAVRFDLYKYADKERQTPSDELWMSLTVQLDACSASLEFSMSVNWQEEHKFLKVEHAVAVRSPFATYDTQFGCLQRPTHQNTSWDWSKYEVCAHKWMDLSEPGCGVALLNDSKYGHSCRGNTLSLSLLRSPKAPDAHCDMGQQTARWALLPHAGFQALGVASEIIRAAECFNSPMVQTLVRMQAPSVVKTASFFSLEAVTPGLCISLSAVKDTEEKDDTRIVVRMYEAVGGRGRGRLTSSTFTFKEVQTCNLLEDDDAVHDAKVAIDIDPSGNFVEFTVRPFQIISLKLIVACRE